MDTIPSVEELAEITGQTEAQLQKDANALSQEVNDAK